jgi:heme/copper-type cytochrome/quinol oxidase subunit 2
MSVGGQPARLVALLYVLVGPVAWAAHLFLLYAAQTLACLDDPEPGGKGIEVFTVITTVIVLAGLAAVSVATFHDLHTAPADRRILDRVTLILCGLSALAVLWTASGPLILPACAPPFI